MTLFANCEHPISSTENQWMRNVWDLDGLFIYIQCYILACQVEDCQLIFNNVCVSGGLLASG